jgi:hypothetical protein
MSRAVRPVDRLAHWSQVMGCGLPVVAQPRALSNPRKEDTEQESPVGFPVLVGAVDQRIMAVQSHHLCTGDPGQMPGGSRDVIERFLSDPTDMVAENLPYREVVLVRAAQALIDADLSGEAETSGAGPRPQRIQCTQIVARRIADVFDAQCVRRVGALLCPAGRDQHGSLCFGVRWLPQTDRKQIAQRCVVYAAV